MSKTGWPFVVVSDAAKVEGAWFGTYRDWLGGAMGEPPPAVGFGGGCGVRVVPTPAPETAELRPPPEHEDKPLHWVERSDGTKWVWEWVVGKWFIPGVAALLAPYDHASLVGYRYLGPAEWRDPRVQGRACEKQPDGTFLGVLDVDTNDPEQAGAALIGLTKAAGELRARIAELEAENARLRARCAPVTGEGAQSGGFGVSVVSFGGVTSVEGGASVSEPFPAAALGRGWAR